MDGVAVRLGHGDPGFTLQVYAHDMDHQALQAAESLEFGVLG